MSKKKQTTMGQFFEVLPTDNGQTLLTKFFQSSNKEENKYQYLFEREEAQRRKRIEQENERIAQRKAEERRKKQELKKEEMILKKEEFEVDQERRRKEEELKHVGKEIVPGLYLGSRFAAKNFEWINGTISAVLNVSQEVKNYFEGEQVCTIGRQSNIETMSDSEIENLLPLEYKRIVCQDAADQNLSQFFEESISFISSIITQNGAVLVHCREGLSRSPSTVIAYLMRVCEWNLNRSYHYVLEKNYKLRINDGFKRQLMHYELALFNQSSLDFFNKRTTRTSNTTTITQREDDPMEQ